ncbi:MAG TPA: hypothetical protein VGO37_05980 [Steroidobacteraceae bacterium]|jgi:hypothetical protein|nr:hypothetical protein [Steroidobacteraceae bacterium]
MARPNAQPTMDAQRGAAALDDDIPRVLRVLGATSLEVLGWSRPNRLSLLIPVFGVHQGVRDDYLLRLGFQAYREWPPSAQFVNPTTLAYTYPQDQHYVPMLTSPECHTHVAYDRPPGKIQLICCSATLEFYEVLHGVDSSVVWRETDTFYLTITAIQKALSSFYQGRFPIHGP